IYGQAMLKHRDRVTGVVLRGISVKTALNVISFGKIKEGKIEYLSTETPEKSLSRSPGIAIGKELAQNLGLNLFDMVEIVLPMGIPTPMGIVPRIKKFRVVGIFDSGFYEYDSSLVFMSLADAQKFLNMMSEVTGIGIKVNDVYRAKAIAGTIEKKLGFTYWARNWMEMNKNLFSALRLEKRVMFIILSLIVLVAAFSIITSLIMSVMEKTRDIAVLKSMGATARSIMKIFMIQGLIIGAIGTTLGCITGITVALNLEKLTAFIENLFGFKVLPQDVYYLSDLPSQVNYGDVTLIVIITAVICFLASIYPSWNASKLDPAEALRYE
ncbi:MAG: FtsX-like permease family protein, partial [Syntrophaceae bacterium]|nr:FtsX-like permease family protein [Syntrophaceae bacterium]